MACLCQLERIHEEDLCGVESIFSSFWSMEVKEGSLRQYARREFCECCQELYALPLVSPHQ